MSVAGSLSPLVDLVFPPRCPLCGEGISGQDGLCVSCWENLVIPGNPACAQCGRPFDGGIVQGSTCAPCLADPPRHDGIAAATLYNDTSRKLVLSFKYGRKIALASMMARLMAAKLDFVDETWLIVPVPLHRWRIWRRGFNQSAILSKEIARLTGAQLCIDALKRKKATRALGGLGAKARKRELSGAIAASKNRSALLKNANVLLVDDVLTSGATSDACVAVLKKADAERVVISCFARVLDEALDVV
ncbi:MAG: ComF family protein [Sphingomonadaceae bacterium]|nr:ComF family protein [Sphingomonadaceae bacterium]